MLIYSKIKGIKANVVKVKMINKNYVYEMGCVVSDKKYY